MNFKEHGDTFEMKSEITSTEFLSAFNSDKNRIINLRSFGAKDSQGIAAKTYKTTVSTFENDRLLQLKLASHNEVSGIYFVVNSGGNKDAEITQYNAFFAEIDNKPMDEQHRLFDECSIQPSIRLETKKSVHAYWLIDGECSKDQWIDVQTRLIANLDSDKSIKNPSRCMRLPNFNHVSYDNETGKFSCKMTETVAFDPERRFTVEEMKQAFPLPKSTERAEPKKECDTVTGVTSESTLKSYETWSELNLELGLRIMAQGRRNASGKYEMRCPVHNGESQTSLFFDPETTKTKCLAECPYSEILKAFGLPEKPTKEERKEKQSQSTLVVKLADNIELFTSQDNEPYATIQVDAHKENWL